MLRFLDPDLRFPLERGVRLGNKRRNRDVDVVAAGALAAALDLCGEFDKRLQILLGFRRQPHHEIQLDQPPARLVGVPGGLQQILGTDPLVDQVAQPFATGFRSEGKTGFTNFLDLLHQFRGQRSDPQARQRHGHPVAGHAQPSAAATTVRYSCSHRSTTTAGRSPRNRNCPGRY